MRHEQARATTIRKWHACQLPADTIALLSLMRPLVSPSIHPLPCSTWVTINMTTRRLAKIPDELRKRLMQLTPPPTT